MQILLPVALVVVAVHLVISPHFCTQQETAFPLKVTLQNGGNLLCNIIRKNIREKPEPATIHTQNGSVILCQDVCGVKQATVAPNDNHQISLLPDLFKACQILLVPRQLITQLVFQHINKFEFLYYVMLMYLLVTSVKSSNKQPKADKSSKKQPKADKSSPKQPKAA